MQCVCVRVLVCVCMQCVCVRVCVHIEDAKVVRLQSCVYF